MACNRHPLDQRSVQYDPDTGKPHGYSCLKCGRYVPKEKSLRGKRANRRGRRESARIAADTGGENHEVRGTMVDVATGGIYNVQSKKDKGLFSERHWKLLTSIPSDGRVPALVVKDAPGPGKKVRGYAVLRYEDWLDLTGVRG